MIEPTSSITLFYLSSFSLIAQENRGEITVYLNISLPVVATSCKWEGKTRQDDELLAYD
jgi:hypothetical protein